MLKQRLSLRCMQKAPDQDNGIPAFAPIIGRKSLSSGTPIAD